MRNAMEILGVPEIPEGEWLTNFSMTKDYAKSMPALPPSWKESRIPHNHPLYGAHFYQKGTRNALHVILDCSVFWDTTRWVHVSCSRKDRMPTYEDLVEVKAVFIGPDRQAIQLFPKKEKHVNIHPFCLHLWCCLDGDGLPDFGRYGTI